MMKRYSAKILVNFKKSIRDSKAEVVERIIKSSNLEASPRVSIGKIINFSFSAENIQKAKEKTEKTCEDIFYSPALEEYEIISINEIENE